MPDNDNYLAEQQLKQDMARGRPPKQVPEPIISQGEAEAVEFLNEVAVKKVKKGPATSTGAGKRKRGQSAENLIEEKPRKRRIAEREDNVTESRGAGKAIPAKLARPSQPPRNMIPPAPAVKKKGKEVYDFPETTEPLKNGAGSSAKGTKNPQLTGETTVLAEGHSSAILNGRANITEKSGRGRPKTKTTSKTSGARPTHLAKTMQRLKGQMRMKSN